MDKTDLIYDMLKDVKTELADIRTDVKNEMAEVRTTVKNELAEMRTDVDGLMAYKNKLVGGAVVTGFVFTVCFEVLKNFITRA